MNARALDSACTGQSLRRVVLTSSGGSVYGHPEHIPVDEDHPRIPISMYGHAKCVMEDVLRAHANGGQAAVILRPGNIYGAEYLADGAKGVVGAFARSLMRGKPVVLRDEGRARRDFVHVDDVVTSVMLALDWPGRFAVWNVGTGIATETREILQMVSGILDRPPVGIVHHPVAPTDVADIALATDRIRRDCGWTPAVSLARGLEEMLAR